MPADMSPVQPAKKTLTDFCRSIFNTFLNKSAVVLDRIGVTANLITVMGFLGAFVAAFLVYRGSLLAAGIVAGASAALDAFDGTLARYQGVKSQFGAFLDSTLDRYSEGLLMIGFSLYFLSQGKPVLIVITVAAVLGSVLVSYTRARGEAVGYKVQCGIFTRLERTIVMVLSLLTGFPEAGIILIAVFANLTALQRILSVVQQERTRSREEE